jgi:Autotransporter beta-domain
MKNKQKYLFRSRHAKTALCVACTLLAASPVAVQAACGTLFEATVTSGGISQQLCRDSIESLYENAIRDAGSLFPSYTETSNLSSNVRVLGVDAALNYAENSRTLTFVIPDLGINQSFTGATRRDSAILLRNYLRDNPDILGRLQRRQAEVSPYSPITGAGGVLPRAILNDFSASFGDSPTRIATSQSNASQGSQSVLGVGVLLSSQSVLDAKVNTIAVPLSYTVRNDIDPRRQALVRGGFGIVDSAGSRSYQGRLSGGYRFPMSDQWVLTPLAGLSFAGSRDAAFAVGIINASLASTYTWEFDSFDLTMGNMVGYYQTFKPPVKYASDPKIRIGALVNGLFLSQPVSLGGSKMSVEYGFSDTRLGGTELYQNNSQELTVSLGTNKSALSARSFFRATLAIQRAKDSKGVSLGVNYWF